MNLRPLALLLCCGALTAQDDGVFEPGVQHVCVPTADREGWDCGTASAPPENYRQPEPEASSIEPAAEVQPLGEPEAVHASAIEDDSPAPPPFLADPTRDTPYAPVEEAPEPVAEAPQPVATPTPPPQPEPEALPEPEPIAEAPAPPPTPAPVDTDSSLSGAEAFARLPAASFTLQLAYAGSMAGFPQLVANLGLDPATCYVLRVRAANGSMWLLAHGAFADVASARAAQAALPRVAGLSAQWPRRIGALQAEVAGQ